MFFVFFFFKTSKFVTYLKKLICRERKIKQWFVVIGSFSANWEVSTETRKGKGESFIDIVTVLTKWRDRVIIWGGDVFSRQQIYS